MYGQQRYGQSPAGMWSPEQERQRESLAHPAHPGWGSLSVGSAHNYTNPLGGAVVPYPRRWAPEDRGPMTPPGPPPLLARRVDYVQAGEADGGFRVPG